MSLLTELVEAACRVNLKDLNGEAREKLDLCLIANLTVGLAGTPVTRVPEPAHAEGRHILVSGRRAQTPQEAAFYNGAAMHARTQDDFHPVGNLHLGTVVIPAALAAAEQSGADGVRFLEGVIAGYQVAIALARVYASETTPKGLRATTLYAPFGAAAAAAHIFDLNEADYASALAITTSLVGGITQCWVDGSDEYQVHAGQAAEGGLKAANLAKSGVRGAANAFEGKAGFLRAFVGPSAKAEALDLDSSRALTETVLKGYPVSGICQPIVYLAERVVAKGVRAEDIERIHIWMNTSEMNYPGTLNTGPFHSFSDILMSAACLFASVVVKRRLSFEDLLTLESEPRRALIERIEISDDASLGKLSDRVEIRLQDGTVIKDAIESAGEIIAPRSDNMDEWARDLWSEAGRGDGYETFRTAIAGLTSSDLKPLIAALESEG